MIRLELRVSKDSVVAVNETLHYTICEYNLGGSVWIENSIGEAMEVKGEKFFELIDKFFKENM